MVLKSNFPEEKDDMHFQVSYVGCACAFSAPTCFGNPAFEKLPRTIASSSHRLLRLTMDIELRYLLQFGTWMALDG